MHRRQVLQGAAIATTASLAGCADVINAATGGGGDDRKHELSGGAWQDVGEYSTNQEAKLTATVRLESGEYAARGLEPTINVSYEIEWDADGTPVDVYLLDESEYDNRWREESDIQYNTAWVQTGSASGSIEANVQAGNYALIVSNSEAYGTDPSGDVSADLTMTATF